MTSPGTAEAVAPIEKAGAKPSANPLQLEGIVKRFRQGDSKVEAIRQASLSVAPGEFVAIMGASGSGKSTLLHVAAGLTLPDAGRVLVEGQELSKLSDAQLTRFRRRRIGLVFQSFNLIPSLTAEDNITLPALTEGREASIKQETEALLARLGIAQRRKHRPDALSGGEQQRVAIARALIMNPALVMADEPTGSLDSVSGQNICQLLSELSHEQKRTIVVVTHEPAVARWAQRVVVMKDGRILSEFGTRDFQTPHDLAAHYQDIVNAAQQI